MNLADINLVDMIAVLLVGLAIIFGWRSGFFVQALALAGFVAGLALVIVLAPTLADAFAEMDTLLRTLLLLGIVAGVVFLAQGIGSSLGSSVRRRVGRGVIGGVDNGAGALFGLARGIFIVWLMGGLLALFPVPALAAEARQSVVLRALDTRLPSPVVLAAELGRVLEEAGLPDVLVGAPPPVEAPAGGPDAAQAEQIAAAARRSTVRVESLACGRFMTGSGFAVTADHLITNAHVVAGAEKLWISFDGSFDRLPALLVHLDTQLDIAVLAVPGLAIAPLVLADSPPGRGAEAAALGFTGGGRQRVIPAIVSRTIPAFGRDIYGGAVVARDVVELRADVAPGDSGGPVLLSDGTVGGVTFSESRADESIGYALSPVAVANSIRGTLRSEASVASGTCISAP